MFTINTNINRPEITPEEIATGKNFDKLYTNYTKVTTPFYKKNWFRANILILSAVIVTTVFFVNTDVEQQIVTRNEDIEEPIATEIISLDSIIKEEQPFIVPPIKELNVQFSSYNVQSVKGKKIKHNCVRNNIYSKHKRRNEKKNRCKMPDEPSNATCFITWRRPLHL